jgi:hypothetical protein
VSIKTGLGDSDILLASCLTYTLRLSRIGYNEKVNWDKAKNYE